MKLLSTIGRVLYGLPLVIFGINHLRFGAGMAGAVPAFMPFKTFWVYFTGLALIVGAIALIANLKYAKLAALLLGALLASFALLIHLPGVTNPETMASSLPQFLKDLAIAGGAFFIAAHSKK